MASLPVVIERLGHFEDTLNQINDKVDILDSRIRESNGHVNELLTWRVAHDITDAESSEEYNDTRKQLVALIASHDKEEYHRNLQLRWRQRFGSVLDIFSAKSQTILWIGLAIYALVK